MHGSTGRARLTDGEDLAVAARQLVPLAGRAGQGAEVARAVPRISGTAPGGGSASGSRGVTRCQVGSGSRVGVGPPCHPGTVGMNRAARDRMERQFADASALGHSFGDFEQQRATRSQTGNVAVCSCGWRSTPRARKVVAASAAYFHVAEVLDAHAAGAPPAEFSQAPATKQLRSATTRIAHSA